MMKRVSSKGFTLIELLAVIVIMGILMMVAIPAISRIIENSRKDTFVDIAKAYVNSVRTAWTSDNLQCGSENISASAMDDGHYYVLIDTANDVSSILDQGGKSSWGNRNVKGYVRVYVTTEGDRKITKYYVALTDGTHGIYDDFPNPTEADKLVRGDVLMNLNTSSQSLKLKAVSTKPFASNRVTTCSSEGGNWTGTMYIPKYFAFGNPTTSSSTNYTTLGKNVFAGLDADGIQKSVCIVKEGSLECFKNNNMEKESDHLKAVFGESSCSFDSSSANCYAADFGCYMDSYGGVYCADNAESFSCSVYSDGSFNCGSSGSV